MKQPDLFLACLAESFERQGELFEHTTETDLRCVECGAWMVETESGWLCCPKGHGKLLPQAEEACGSWFEGD
jgi:hypothetical protein